MTKKNKNIFKFRKMNGAGNTFLFHDSRNDELIVNKELIRNLQIYTTDYKFDQFITIEKAKRGGNCKINFWNADGTESGMCGNALRCIGDLLLDEIKKDKVIIETIDKNIECWRSENNISVNIGKPLFSWSEIPLSNPTEDTLSIKLEPFDFDLPKFSAVNVGNPHAVFFFSNEKPEINKMGTFIENHNMFSDKVNVSFAELIDKDHIYIDVWERGTGVTKACGSAACATTVVAASKGITSRNTKVSFSGGDLKIYWKNDNSIVMTGPYELNEILQIDLSDL